MEQHLSRTFLRRPKRRLNMNDLLLSPSFHHARDPKQSRAIEIEATNQNRSSSPLHVHQRRVSKRKRSSSYTSLDLSSKELGLCEKDFDELRQALRILFCYTNNEMRLDDQQRLSSPYLRRVSDPRSHPLYTDEYFIRNGLLNHNDGPEIRDTSVQPVGSSVNTAAPLAVLPNETYLFTAMTSNFASEASRRSSLAMDLPEMHDQKNQGDEDLESESKVIRRHKVHAWERENILQQTKSMTHLSVSPRDSLEASMPGQTPSASSDSQTNANADDLPRTYSSEVQRSSSLRNTDRLFPMIRKLGRKHANL